MELEYKQIPFEVKQIGDDDEDDSFHIFEGMGSTFGNVDLGDDVVVKGAFSKSLKEREPVILWQHDMREPIGTPIELKETDKGLFVKARMPKEDTLVSGRIMPQMRAKSIKSMSIGFSVTEFEIEKGIRHIKEAKLFEISLVTIPMNPKAEVTNFKSASTALVLEQLEAMSKKELEEYLRGSGLFSRKASKLIVSGFPSQCDADKEQCDAVNPVDEELKKLKESLTKL
jgi:HK97 family phage prohead protease